MTHKLFIETAIDSRTKSGVCCGSTLREATDSEIAKFKGSPCDHSSVELLIYDVSCYMYDFRHCAVCNTMLGMI